MPSSADAKLNGSLKTCRDCDKPIYLHRGTNGPWRAYDPLDPSMGEAADWQRHRCPSALQDAELLGIIAPAGTKPADFIPRLKRVITDLQSIVDQAETAAREAAAASAAATN